MTLRSDMNRVLRNGTSQIVRIAIRSTVCPSAPSPPVPARSRASPSEGPPPERRGGRRPAELGPLQSGRMPPHLYLARFRRHGPSHHRQPWGAGKSVGEHVLHWPQTTALVSPVWRCRPMTAWHDEAPYQTTPPSRGTPRPDSAGSPHHKPALSPACSATCVACWASNVSAPGTTRRRPTARPST